MTGLGICPITRELIDADVDWTEGDPDMELEYAGFYPMTDLVNVLFALPNMFEDIVYKHEDQIREVHCRELKVEGPVCVVRFSNLLPSSW
jgi:hypothetical protein